MALYPWRFQSDIPKGQTDPVVTVYLGPERAKLDADGNPTSEGFIEQSTSDARQCKLSELPAALADPSTLKKATTP